MPPVLDPYLVLHRDRYPMQGSSAPFGRLHFKRTALTPEEAREGIRNYCRANQISGGTEEIAELERHVDSLTVENSPVNLPDGTQFALQFTTWSRVIGDLITAGRISSIVIGHPELTKSLTDEWNHHQSFEIK